MTSILEQSSPSRMEAAMENEHWEHRRGPDRPGSLRMGPRSRSRDGLCNRKSHMAEAARHLSTSGNRREARRIAKLISRLPELVELEMDRNKPGAAARRSRSGSSR